jgi:Rrf2 family protein
MVYLAKRVDEWPIAGRTIAGDTGIPGKYLLAILRTLVRGRILDSSPGRGGGFSLARSAREITLFEVLGALEQSFGTRSSCPFADGPCDEDNPCPAHERWSRMRDESARFLEETSLHAVAFGCQDSGNVSEITRKRR